ncbi:MAG: iron ABC transporter [Gemmataceae bacterium]|nr:iron ABC transporter [Gemmataceae bacterium]
MTLIAPTSTELHQAFWTIAVASVCSISCALLGCFLLLKRMSMLGDAIGHGVLPGIVLAVLLTGQITSVYILVGAMVFGLVTAILAETLSASTSVTEDASLGVVYTSLFAVGVILLSKYLRFAHIDLDCVFLGLLEVVPLNTADFFGLEIPRAIPTMLLMLFLTLAFLGFFWKELTIVAFDPALAQSMGFSPRLVNYLLIALVAGSTVSAFEAVGLILVLAVLIVPAATAYLLTDRLGPMLGWAALSAFSASVLGYLLRNIGGYSLDISGMVAVILGLQFVLAVLFAPRHGLAAQGWRNFHLSLRIAQEDILATLYRAEEASVKTYSLALKDHGLSTWVVWLAHHKLVRLGLLATSAAGLPVLTEEGRRLGQYVVRSHRLWETYAGAILEIPPDHVHAAAALVEHFIGPQLQDELASTLQEPAKDPHGKSIPPAQNDAPSAASK